MHVGGQTCMSLISCCVVKQLGHLRPLAARYYRTAPLTAVRKCWGASFGRQSSSSVAEDRVRGTDGVPLNQLRTFLRRATLEACYGSSSCLRMTIMSKRYVEASLSSGVKLYRVPIHFPGNLFNTSSTSKHVSVMFKGEGTSSLWSRVGKTRRIYGGKGIWQWNSDRVSTWLYLHTHACTHTGYP